MRSGAVMDETTRKVEQFILSNGLIAEGDRLLLSLSAGKDSMAMLYILAGIASDGGFSLGVFHLNHMARGSESDGDEKFLQKLCGRMDIEIFTEKYDFSQGPSSGGSFEERARRVRYGLLRDISEREGYTKICTAHNRDDNIETLLYRMFTGTGISGLGGIPVRRNDIIRPILCLSGEEVYRYLERCGIEWREDSSNRDESYKRNFIRNRIIPSVREGFPMADRALSSLIEASARNQSLLRGLLMEKYNGLCEKTGECLYIESEPIMHDFNLFSHAFSFCIADHLPVFINQNMLREIFSSYKSVKSNCLLYRNRDITVDKLFHEGRTVIRISPTAETPKEEPLWEHAVPIPESGDRFVQIPELGIAVTVKFVDYIFFEKYQKNKKFVFITLDNKNDSLYIRNRRKGDRITTEAGTKKIKDILIEKKLDNKRKNCVPLLIADKAIAAVMPGLLFDLSNRIALNFRVDKNSKKVLAIYTNH